MTKTSGNYKLDKGRIVVSTGRPCPIGCSYCYTYSDDFVSFPRKTPEQIVSDLSTFANRIDLVQLGCDTELFLHQDEAIELIKGIAGLDRDVSFATKMCLSDRTIDELASTYETMRRSAYHTPGTENYMAAFVSLIGLETAQRLEPKAPSPERRIKTIKRLHQAGIPTYVFMRPLLPIVSEEELDRLFEQTREHCDGYVVGELYCDGEIMSRLGLTGADSRKKMAWGLDQRTWDVFIDERIAHLAEQKDVFSSSLEAFDVVRGKRYQEALIEGMANMEGGANFLEGSVYSARLAVPDNVKHIHVMAEKDSFAPGLSLSRNVFTGEQFEIPAVSDIDAVRKFYFGNTMVINQPPNAYLASPRHILLEDGRLFASGSFIGNFDLNEATVQSLLKSLESMIHGKDDLVRVCESLDRMLMPLELDHETFRKIQESTTVR